MDTRFSVTMELNIPIVTFPKISIRVEWIDPIHGGLVRFQTNFSYARINFVFF